MSNRPCVMASRSRNYLEQPQRHTAIDRPAVAGEKRLLPSRGTGGFSPDHLAGCGVFLIRDVVELQIELGESEPGILQLKILVNIHIRNHIGGDAERIAVVQEVAIVITAFDPAAPSGRLMS